MRIAPLMSANSFENRQLCTCGKTVYIKEMSSCEYIFAVFLLQMPACSACTPSLGGSRAPATPELLGLPCKSCAEIPNRGHCIGLNAGIRPCQHWALGDATHQMLHTASSERWERGRQQSPGCAVPGGPLPQHWSLQSRFRSAAWRVGRAEPGTATKTTIRHQRQEREEWDPAGTQLPGRLRVGEKRY